MQFPTSLHAEGWSNHMPRKGQRQALVAPLGASVSPPAASQRTRVTARRPQLMAWTVGLSLIAGGAIVLAHTLRDARGKGLQPANVIAAVATPEAPVPPSIQPVEAATPPAEEPASPLTTAAAAAVATGDPVATPAPPARRAEAAPVSSSRALPPATHAATPVMPVMPVMLMAEASPGTSLREPAPSVPAAPAQVATPAVAPPESVTPSPALAPLKAPVRAEAAEPAASASRSESTVAEAK